MDDDVSLIEEISQATLTRSTCKVFEHIPPRVDAEKYQADIPPMICSSLSLNSASEAIKLVSYCDTGKISMFHAIKLLFITLNYSLSYHN